jgi:hypothetical protein
MRNAKQRFGKLTSKEEVTWKENIKMDLGGMGCEAVDWIQLDMIGRSARLLLLR